MAQRIYRIYLSIYLKNFQFHYIFNYANYANYEYLIMDAVINL